MKEADLPIESDPDAESRLYLTMKLEEESIKNLIRLQLSTLQVKQNGNDLLIDSN